MNTPLLLIAWRRPDTLRQVIQAIRPVAPTHLYVACDGPNPSRAGEAEKVAATRKVIENEIDWPCQIQLLYSDVNQGCRLGVSSAITWFFDQVAQGIILEDDCIPHPEFFAYCTDLLDRYRDDMRVWCISGNNFQNGQWRGDGSYYFSRYAHCWGWASWRNRWEHLDLNLGLWPSLRDSSLLQSIFDNPLELRYWSDTWQRLLDHNKPDTWDFQWFFTCFINGSLAALPNENLVSNIGFGVDATNTLIEAPPTMIGESIFPIVHPTYMLRNAEADNYFFKTNLRPLVSQASPFHKSKQLVRKILNRLIT